MPRFTQYFIFISTLIINIQSHGLPSDRQQPINIEADQALFDQLQSFTQYTGNVKLAQGSLLIKAENIEIYQDEQQQLKMLKAIGSPVHLEQQTLDNQGNQQLVQAEANSLNYSILTHEVQLSGNAQFKRQATEVSGESIVYNIQTDVFSASNQISDDQSTANNRVKITIPANELKQKSQEN